MVGLIIASVILIILLSIILGIIVFSFGYSLFHNLLNGSAKSTPDCEYVTLPDGERRLD